VKKIILFLCFFVFGCSVAPFVVSPIVTGVIMWKQGEAKKYYNEEIDVIYRSVKHSLVDLEYKILKDEKVRDGYFITSGEKDKFKIKIRMVKAKITEVSIRINMMGDKPYAELLYNHIDANTNTIYFNDKGLPVKLTDLP
jgi:hypothetical protein